MSSSLRGAWDAYAGAITEALSATEGKSESAAAKVQAARQNLTASSLNASLQLRDAEQFLQINTASTNQPPPSSTPQPQ